MVYNISYIDIYWFLVFIYYSQPINPRKFEQLQRASDLNLLLGQNFDQNQSQNITNSFAPNFMYDQLYVLQFL